MDNKKNEIKCVECGRILAESKEDHTYLRIGMNIDYWGGGSLSCRCGKPLKFRAEAPEIALTPEQFKIIKATRDSLANRPWTRQEEKKDGN